MARRFNYVFRIVTLDGELINAGGSMTGGSVGNRTTSIIGRNRVIGEIEKELVEKKAQLKNACSKIKAMELEFDNISAGCTTEQKLLSDFELIRLRDESHVVSILENIEKITAKVDLMKQQDLEIEDQIEEVKKESEKEDLITKAIEEEIGKLKEIVLSHQTKNKTEQIKRRSEERL